MTTTTENPKMSNATTALADGAIAIPIAIPIPIPIALALDPRLKPDHLAAYVIGLARRGDARADDAAQERGEVGKRGDYGAVSSKRELTPATASSP